MKRIAILLCGLCNADPSNFDGIYGVFDRLEKEHNIKVTYFMHLWNHKNIFPINYNARKKFIRPNYSEYIPKERMDLQRHLVNYLQTKKVLRSDFAEMMDRDYYDNFPHYVGYVNTTAQFYALEKLLNTYDFSKFDLIFRWRYDLVINHHKFIDEIVKTLDQISTKVPTIVTEPIYKIGGIENLGNNDRWFGFNYSAIEDFKRIHRDMYIETGALHRNKIYIEEAFLNFIEKKNLARHEILFSNKILRMSMRVSENFSELSREEQEEELINIPSNIGPEHANVGYDNEDNR